MNMIHENVSFKSLFNFKEICESDIQSEVCNLNSKKTGTFGNITTKVLKDSSENWIYEILGKQYFFFFSYLVFLSRTFMIHRTAGKGEAISLSPLYHFHQPHRHLDISRAITAGSSYLHIASSRTRTGYLWFPSASR